MHLLMNKPVYLELSIIKLSEILICEFWYDCIKPKHGENAILCYMNTYSFKKVIGLMKDESS